MKYFKEKSSLDEGWINGGFVIEPEILDYKMISPISNVLLLKKLQVLASCQLLNTMDFGNAWIQLETKKF